MTAALWVCKPITADHVLSNNRRSRAITRFFSRVPVTGDLGQSRSTYHRRSRNHACNHADHAPAIMQPTTSYRGGLLMPCWNTTNSTRRECP